MRWSILYLFVLVVLLFAAAFAAAFGEDPPVVQIVDMNLNDVETLVVGEGEAFSLIGLATGAIPLYFFWLEGDTTGSIVSQGQYLLDHSFSDPGAYALTLQVVDAYDQSGYDTVVVTVTGGPVATEPTTWGGLKALFRR